MDQPIRKQRGFSLGRGRGHAGQRWRLQPTVQLQHNHACPTTTPAAALIKNDIHASRAFFVLYRLDLPFFMVSAYIDSDTELFRWKAVPAAVPATFAPLDLGRGLRWLGAAERVKEDTEVLATMFDSIH